MDRRKSRWFIVLGILFACGLLLLLGWQWIFMPSEPVPAPASVTAIQVVDREPEVRASTHVEAEPTDVTSAPAAIGGTYRGRVIDAVTRRPVRKFDVHLLRVQSVDDTPRRRHLKQTFQSNTGRFAWSGLQGGTWTAAVSAQDYQLFGLAEFTIVAGKEAPEIVIPLLRGFAVRGRVFDARTGVGIGGAYVRVAERSAWGVAEGSGPDTQSRSDGTFELDGVPGGDRVLVADSMNYAAGEVTVVVNDETPPVEIGLARGGAISGRIMTSGGAPIKATIILSGPDGGPYQTTDEGMFSFDHLRAGTYTLTATTTAGSAKEQIELAEEEVRSDVTLAVREGRTVRGTLHGLRPDQLEGAFVLARTGKKEQFFNSRADDQGAYALKGLPSGRATLTAMTRTRQVEKTVDVPADRDLVLDFVFPLGARLSGRITQGGKPAADSFVVVGSEGPKAQIVYQGQIAQDGQYEVEGLPAGEYRLTVAGEMSRSITVAGDTVLNIDIPSVQVGGSVLEEGGAVPIVRADIYVRGLDAATSHVHAHRQSDDFGQFQLIGVEPGDVELTVYKPGYEMYREKIAYSSPITQKTIRLRRGGGVQVRVQRSASGAPAHGFVVSEKIARNPWAIDYWIALDRDGIGFLPSALTGSTLVIDANVAKPISIREWDGSSLDLKF
jgi:hypothetical protein